MKLLKNKHIFIIPKKEADNISTSDYTFNRKYYCYGDQNSNKFIITNNYHLIRYKDLIKSYVKKYFTIYEK